jgi:hypothetical protein
MTNWAEYDINQINLADTPPAPQGDFEPLPEGVYKIALISHEQKATKANDGLIIALRFDVTEGKYAGRVLWVNANIVNKSEKAQEISRRLMASLFNAWGCPPEAPMRDTLESGIGREVIAKVAVRAASNGYKASNEIRTFYATDESAPKVAVAPNNVAPPSATADGGKRPWER